MRLTLLSIKATGISLGFYCLFFSLNAQAQKPLSYRLQDLKSHGIQQYHQGHYNLASETLKEYLNAKNLPPANDAEQSIHAEREEALYYQLLSDLKSAEENATIRAVSFIQEKTNPVFRQRLAFALAQEYFKENNLSEAIRYYEIAGIENLSNAEIADAKFELAYCYFNEQRFSDAFPLFAAIKELPENKYYIAGNYYYGLLAYNNKDYESALKSFNRINKQEIYKDIVPYYQAEIYYFLGDPDKVLKLSESYLRKKGDLFYKKEMQLLTAQTYFEQSKFKEALPFFEAYYNSTDKIRKEELYELAYTYYRLEKWDEAVEKFKPLSNAKDSLGQTSMYLLGDCYLKIGDKQGARNAFGICSDMNFNLSQKEAASFLNAKLSYELGDEGFASRKFYSFLKEFPESQFSNEAKTLLSNLLTKNSNYGEAFAIMNDMPVKDNQTWAIYQQVAVGRAMQLMQNNDLNAADSILNLSLQQPINPNYEAIAYFWKGDIAYLQNRFPQAIQYSKDFIQKAKNRETEIRNISTNATIQNANLNIGYAQLGEEDYESAQQSFSTAQKSRTSGYSDVLAADASLREADAYFMKQELDKAAKSYDEALSSGISNPDYARFQKALIYGLQGKFSEKKSLLNSIIQKSPPSDYKADAQYEMATTLIEQGQFTDAIQPLQALVENPGISENVKTKAQLSLAYAFAQSNKTEEAIAGYKKFLTDFPGSSEKEDALDALRNLYMAQGAPEKYDTYLKDHKMPGVDEASIENTYYESAIQSYGQENWALAAEGFTKYLTRFPNGKNVTKAHFYRGESYFHLKETKKAAEDYESVLTDGWNDFAEESALKAAEIAFKNKDYSKAEQNYRLLRSAAMNESNLQIAYSGLMKTAFFQEKYAESESYADTLATLPNLGKKLETDGLLFKSKALQQQLNYAAAIISYQKLATFNMGAASAEARYRIAEILLAQGKLKEAEAQAVTSAQTSGGEEYWVVNSYILLADILKEQKDYFNAKATLQSILKNASDKELKEKAGRKLEEVKKLEKSNSKLSD